MSRSANWDSMGYKGSMCQAYKPCLHRPSIYATATRLQHTTMPKLEAHTGRQTDSTHRIIKQTKYFLPYAPQGAIGRQMSAPNQEADKPMNPAGNTTNPRSYWTDSKKGGIITQNQAHGRSARAPRAPAEQRDKKQLLWRMQISGCGHSLILGLELAVRQLLPEHSANLLSQPHILEVCQAALAQ